MKTKYFWFTLILTTAWLLTSCGSAPRVGALTSESRSVDLVDGSPVRVEINFGAGDLRLTGGAEKLLEASFNYNVAKLKPEVEYVKGKLVVRQPNANGMPVLQGILDYRNEWGLSLSKLVPMDLVVDMGGGSSQINLAGLSLTRLDVKLGAGTSTLDLRGGWARDLAVTLDTGAAFLTVRLPKNVGVRVKVDPGATMIDTTGLKRDGDVYTNAAYGVSDVTMRVDLKGGIGKINLDVEETAAMSE
jgi:hypothetical protein